MTARNIIKLVLKITVVLIIIIFLGLSVLSNWEKIRIYDWSFNPVLMIVSCLIFIMAFGFLPWVWRKVLYYMGYDLSYGDAWDIFYIGNLGRYIPGKFWSIAGMIFMKSKPRIPSLTPSPPGTKKARNPIQYAIIYALAVNIGFTSPKPTNAETKTQNAQPNNIPDTR